MFYVFMRYKVKKINSLYVNCFGKNSNWVWKCVFPFHSLNDYSLMAFLIEFLMENFWFSFWQENFGNLFWCSWRILVGKLWNFAKKYLGNLKSPKFSRQKLKSLHFQISSWKNWTFCHLSKVFTYLKP